MDGNSKVDAVDLSSGKIYSLASLSLKIKKVTAISSQSLIFINKTDDRDHGREVASYNFAAKITTPLFLADQDFGIDDYVISPSKRYVADWEVQAPSGGQGLIGGRSRVYAIDLRDPSRKNLIYDEAIQDGVPMHYPISVTDSGEVFLDGFIANSLGGWANGMSYSNISGTQKQNISAMTAGTYSTQPVASFDGKYIAFAGYDGVRGTGTSSGEFKQAILNPDTVEILDTSTKQRKKLPDLSNANRYTSVYWDKISNNIIFSMTSKDASQNGFYLYDLGGASYRKIGVGQDDTVISTLSNAQFLTGKADTSDSTIGNLGGKYSSMLGSISVYDSPKNKNIPLAIGIPLIQYIGLLPSNYFSNSLVMGDLTSNSSKTGNSQLQLDALALKPTLAPQREEQQSNKTSQPGPTRCIDLATQLCNSLGISKVASDTRWSACYRSARASLKADGVCYDSPLYLYGEKGTRIDIKINTKITNSIPYSEGNYSVVLDNNGQFTIDGKNYSSIGFSYAPAIEMPKLDYGRVSLSGNVGVVVEEYGKKLGLNKREINDLKNSIGGFSTPYVLVSFFNDNASKKILPISFSPAPDTYRNIVFYFRELDYPINIKEPKFDAVAQRKGLTAVEVSHIIDN